MKGGALSESPFFAHTRRVNDAEPISASHRNDYNRETYVDAEGGRLHHIPYSKMPETQWAVAALLKGNGSRPFSPVSDVVKRGDTWYSYEKHITDADRATLAEFPKLYVVGRVIQALVFGDTDFFDAGSKEKNTKRDTVNSDFALTFDFEQAYYGLERTIHYAFLSPEFRVWFMRRSRAELHEALTTLKEMHSLFSGDDGLSLIRGLEAHTHKSVRQLFNFTNIGKIIDTPEQFRAHLCAKIADAIAVVEFGPGIVLQFDPLHGRMK